MAKKENSLEKLPPVFLVIIIGLAFAVGVLWQKVNSLEKGGARVAQKQANPTPRPAYQKLSKEQAAKIPKITESDHIRGSQEAKVFLIEYSDLECPYCRKFHPFAQKAVDEYGGKVSWVYRHFPLDIHPKAKAKAQATECAAELGGNDGFWAYVDKLFEVAPSKDDLGLDKLPELANEVGLDGQKLKTCLDSGKYKDKVEKDYQGGVAAGVSGTPTSFIINNKGEVWIISGAAPFESFKPAIEEALK